MPINISLILLLIAIIIFKSNNKLSRIFLISGFLILFLSSSAYFSDALIKPLETKYSVFEKQTKPLDYIVVLGCGHTTNNALPVIQELKVCSLQRFVEAYRIYQLHPEATLITSGYSFGDDVSNAQKMKEAAISFGIPELKIMIEERPKDTGEEALLISPLLQGKNFALVTNADHMPRAYKYFEAQGLSPLAAPTGFLYKGPSTNLLSLLPNADKLNQTTRAWYESLGLITQWFTQSNEN